VALLLLLLLRKRRCRGHGMRCLVCGHDEMLLLDSLMLTVPLG
jgi:hypothetical protein